MMAAPSGLAGQFGFKTESVYGTGVTVDKFAPILNENVDNNIERLVSKGITAGRRTVRTWKPGASVITGPIALELNNKPTATLLTHMFGNVVDAGAGPYTHTATPGDLTGKSFTAQFGRPDITGTVQPFTYSGCKIVDWAISAQVSQIAALTLNISAQAETTATGLAAVSYLSGIAPFVFTEGVIQIAGAQVATCSQFDLKGTNGLNTTRKRLGFATVNQQLEGALRDYSGTIMAEFESLTAYNRYTAGTEAAIVLTFTSGTDVLAITLNARFDGKTPGIAGEAILSQPLPFVCDSTTSDASAITMVLTNAETVST